MFSKTGRKFVLALCAVFSVVVIYSCSKEKKTDATTTDYDAFKTGMLTNYADNIIIPAYVDLAAKIDTLETSVNVFLATPSVATQDAMKAPFKAAYTGYEKISVAYFGPSAVMLLNNYIGYFPSNITRIESGVQSGVYNFAIPTVSDSIQGFAALDYLLFSQGAVAKFADANAANRKKYVKDVIDVMKLLTSNTLNQWKGNYRSSFITSLKTNVGSSIGNMVNQFAYEMDALKGPRIGWPFGKQSNGIVFAEKCEGYYSGISLSLAIANLTSLKNYYTGANGDGIADYLVLLKKDQLNNDVLAQFDVALNALKAIPEPLSASFTNNPAQVEEAYKQIQKLLTLIKTDVASATAVQITYMDNDGD